MKRVLRPAQPMIKATNEALEAEDSNKCIGNYLTGTLDVASSQGALFVALRPSRPVQFGGVVLEHDVILSALRPIPQLGGASSPAGVVVRHREGGQSNVLSSRWPASGRNDEPVKG